MSSALFSVSSDRVTLLPDERVHTCNENNEKHQINGKKLFKNLKTEISRGLCAVVDSVESHKTTFFNDILAELKLDAGSIIFKGALSYESQESCLFEDSVRNEIGMSKSFDSNHIPYR